MASVDMLDIDLKEFIEVLADPEDQRRLIRINITGENRPVTPFGGPAAAGAFLCPNARMRTVFAASPFVCTKLDGLV